MTTIIMIFSLPIGIYILFQERKTMAKYESIFYDFYQKIKGEKELDRSSKIKLLQDMLSQNGYTILHQDRDKIVAGKKLFSVGWLFVGIGTLYVGLIIYIIYYFYIQKPHKVEFRLDF